MTLGLKSYFSRGTLPKCFTWTNKWWFPKPNLLFKGAILRWTILNFETTSLPLKISHPKRKGSSSNHPFSGANLLFVSGRLPIVGKVFLPTTLPGEQLTHGSHNPRSWPKDCPIAVGTECCELTQGGWGWDPTVAQKGGPKWKKTYGIEFIDVKRLQEWSIYVYQ